MELKLFNLSVPRPSSVFVSIFLMHIMNKTETNTPNYRLVLIFVEKICYIFSFMSIKRIHLDFLLTNLLVTLSRNNLIITLDKKNLFTGHLQYLRFVNLLFRALYILHNRIFIP